MIHAARRFPAVTLLASAAILAGCQESTATRTSTGGPGGAEVTAVYSRTSPGYARALDPGGSFKRETYVLADGGNFGGPRTDPTMDSVGFDAIARAIASPLASQGYVPGDPAADASLLIVVYRGVTVAPDDAYSRDNRDSDALKAEAAALMHAANAHMEENGAEHADYEDGRILMEQANAMASEEGAQDTQIDSKNANILGYTEELRRTSPRDPRLSVLLDEIERDRYYVVLLAYDNQLARKFHMRKLLWETRFSIPEPGNDFGKSLPGMAAIACRYFGQDSRGLIHHNLDETHVEIGVPRTIGTTP